MRPVLPITLLAALALSACERKPEAPQAVADNVETRHRLDDYGASGPSAPAAPAIIPVSDSTTAAAAAAGPPPAGAPRLAFPLACEIGKTCEVQHYVDRDPGPGALDYRCGHRTYDKHDGIDIRLLDMKAQARGVDVLAAAAGRVVATRDGVDDISVAVAGKAATEKVACGNRVAIVHGDGWLTDYCHMAKGSIRVKTGDMVTAGQSLGRVGLSGWTEFPHLHISVRHRDVLVDPFDPDPANAGTCKQSAGLWTPEAAKQLAYKAGVILNAGIAGAAVTGDAVQAGDVPPASSTASALAAYMWVIEPQQGDELEITLTGPDGQLATHRLPPLPNDKAQQFQMVGKKRPAAGWPAGTYVADLKVWRAGKVALQKRVSVKL